MHLYGIHCVPYCSVVLKPSISHLLLTEPLFSRFHSITFIHYGFLIRWIYIFCLIIIIESEVWTINHCLGLGHETMVYAVCLSVFIWRFCWRNSVTRWWQFNRDLIIWPSRAFVSYDVFVGGPAHCKILCRIAVVNWSWRHAFTGGTSIVILKTINHDDVINWKKFPCYWPSVPGIHRWPGNSPHKVQGSGALMLSLISTWTNHWVNN